MATRRLYLDDDPETPQAKFAQQQKATAEFLFGADAAALIYEAVKKMFRFNQWMI